MRFVLKAIFWIFVVGMFMPSEDLRASIPELPRQKAGAEPVAAAPSPGAPSLCERSPKACEAVGESRILADIAGAAAEVGVKQIMQSNSLTNPPLAEEPARPAASPAPEAG